MDKLNLFMKNSSSFTAHESMALIVGNHRASSDANYLTFTAQDGPTQVSLLESKTGATGRPLIAGVLAVVESTASG